MSAAVVPINRQAAVLAAASDHVREAFDAGAPLIPCPCCGDRVPLKVTKGGGLYSWCAECRAMVRVMSRTGARSLFARLSAQIAPGLASLDGGAEDTAHAG